MSIAGDPKSIKNLRSGDLLIQCAKEAHEKNLLQMKTFCGLKCSVTPHSSLNTSKGIIRCLALNRVTSDDIKEGMVEQGVTDVRRITVRRDGETKLTNTYVLTFNSPTLPTVVKIGFMQVKVDFYIPKIVSEHDQEIPQPQTADNPVAPRGRAAQPSQDTRKTNQAKQPAPFSPSR